MNAEELGAWLKEYDGEASRIQQQIDRKKAELKSVIPRGTPSQARGQYADQIKQLKDELAQLEKAKADLAAKASASKQPTGGDGSGGEDDKAAKKKAERGKAAIQDLERELVSLGKKTDLEKTLWEIEKGRFADLSQAHKERIEALAREIAADKKRAESMEQLIKRMDEYYEAHRQAVEDFKDDSQKATLSTQKYEQAKLKERYDAYAEHIDDKIALKKWYEAESAKIADKAKEAANKLNEFQIQAYRSMQSAMSEFLVSPFEDGLDGMLRSFGEMVQQMIAEWLAAQAMMGLFGKDFGSGGSLGGLFGGIAGALGFAKGGAFSGGRLIPYAHGGIVGKPTIFPMAQGAGLMGEAGPEAVLPLARTASGDLGVNLASSQQQQAPANNVRIINVMDPSVVGSYLGTAEGEKTVINIVQKNKRVLQ
jgi:lambda family phage tail tape measure protein